MPEQRVNILVYRPDGTLIARYLLGDGEHLIGRNINSAVYLDSEYISSNHAKLHLSHDGIQIEELSYDHAAARQSMESAGLIQGYEKALVLGYWPNEDVLPLSLRRASARASG